MKRFPLMILVIASLCVFSGCPDYSYQRPVPDYENMTDTGEEAYSGENAGKK